VDGLDDAIPLITKGRGEIDGDNRDMNSFLGIRASDTVWSRISRKARAVPARAQPSDRGHHRHPERCLVSRRRHVRRHDVAALSERQSRGESDARRGHIAAGRQHPARRARYGMNSNGTPSGYFQGDLDEPRVWSVARTQAQIQASMDSEILAGSGLVARWGLNEATAALAGSSVVGGPIGFLTGGPTWITDSTLPLSTESGLRFGGTNGYVTFGDADRARAHAVHRRDLVPP
jgi:hypothetical protein